MNTSTHYPENTGFTPPKALPSRFMASLYLPIGVLILIAAGLFDVTPITGYWVGIGAEVLMTLIVLVFLKVEKLPVKQTLRLNKVDWRNLCFGVLAVPGIWLMGIAGNLIVSLLFGYITPVPPSFYPNSVPGYVLFALTAVVVAPICEEIIFRGYFQRAFEKQSPWLAILIGGTIFAMYHLRFQGLFALLPIAYAMSYFAWRSDSIYVSMLMHAVFNSFATFFMVLNSTVPTLILGLIIMLFLAVAVALLPGSAFSVWWVYKHSPLNEQVVKPSTTRNWKHYVWLIPMLIFLAGYGFFAVREFVYMRYPEKRANAEMEFTAYTDMPESLKLEYEVVNMFGDAIGQATCTRTFDNAQINVACSGDVQGSDIAEEFDFDLLEDMAPISTVAQTWTQSSTWSPDLNLVETQLDWRSDNADTILAVQTDGAFTVTRADGSLLSENADTVSQTLAIGEFPWRLQRLPLEMGSVYNTHILIRDSNDGTYQRYEALVAIVGGEPVWTSLQHYTAWKVTIRYTDVTGDSHLLAVWYDADNPDYPVKFSNGDAEYVLKSVVTKD